MERKIEVESFECGIELRRLITLEIRTYLLVQKFGVKRNEEKHAFILF